MNSEDSHEAPQSQHIAYQWHEGEEEIKNKLYRRSKSKENKATGSLIPYMVIKMPERDKLRRWTVPQLNIVHHNHVVSCKKKKKKKK